jgi:hypothetical protein
MPQLRNTRHRDLQHVSDAYPIFGLCLRNENREANGHQAPFDAAAQDAAEDIDMEIIAQSGIPHGSNSLLGRGLWVKFFKAPDGRQRACIAIVRATVQISDPHDLPFFCSPHWRCAAQCLPRRSIDQC